MELKHRMSQRGGEWRQRTNGEASACADRLSEEETKGGG
jgi:hypothetical protein